MANAWKTDYVDKTLIGSGSLSHAAIAGLDGNIWAASDGFNLAPNEVASLIRGFSTPDVLRQNGLVVAGVKYVLLQADESVLLARKERTGICAGKSSTAVVIGVYGADHVAGNANKSVQGLAQYLIGQGI